MGTASNARTGQMTEPNTWQNVQGVGSPITNEAYNIVKALGSKLEGLEAYRKYAKDGDAETWQRLTQVEMASVQTLCEKLEELVRDGKFRMKEPGKANA